jgi:hypothetical protein
VTNPKIADKLRHTQFGIQAESLARMGYVIFPIEAGSKVPLVKWSLNSTCNPVVVRDWWETFPDDNIGINCGLSGLLVVDLDSREALLAFNRLWTHHEQGDVSLSGAPVIRTPRGWHLYFNVPAGDYAIRNSAGAGIDIRAAGGMVVAPGSVVGGSEYKVIDGDLEHLPPLPVWLRVMLTPSLGAPVNYVTNVPDWYAELQVETWTRRIVAAPEGQQNKTINKAAYALHRQGVSADVIRSELLAAAEAGNHPADRARPTIESGIAAARRDSSGTQQ